MTVSAAAVGRLGPRKSEPIHTTRTHAHVVSRLGAEVPSRFHQFHWVVHAFGGGSLQLPRQSEPRLGQPGPVSGLTRLAWPVCWVEEAAGQVWQEPQRSIHGDRKKPAVAANLMAGTAVAFEQLLQQVRAHNTQQLYEDDWLRPQLQRQI